MTKEEFKARKKQQKHGSKLSPRKSPNKNKKGANKKKKKKAKGDNMESSDDDSAEDEFDIHGFKKRNHADKKAKKEREMRKML